ncbi:MAG TPA: septum formation initiator family protein [Rhodoblastus sp.]|nr:septum formation initiator family protein [Rhodoblastus sp.]
MVRTRLTTNIAPIVFHVFAALVSGYFVWHAIHGQRGLKTRDENAEKVADLQTTLDGLRAERARWKHDIDLVRGETIDRDLLEEQARVELGRMQKNEIVIMLPSSIKK